jgi:hypothetical protein
MERYFVEECWLRQSGGLGIGEKSAETQRRAALSRQLAAQTTSLISQGLLDRALLLSQEALRISETMEARSALSTALRYDPRLITFLRGHGGSVLNNMVFSPDGRMLASGSSDGTVILWDLRTLPRRVPEPIGEPLGGRGKWISSVAFSPDSSILASVSSDNAIILWDLQRRQPTGNPLKGHEDLVFSVAFSPDGRILASGSSDNTIILWDLQKGLVPSVAFSKEYACRIANRNLTQAEWKQYLINEPYHKTCPNVLEEPTPTPTPTMMPSVPGPTPIQNLEHFVRDFLTRANNAEIDAYSNSDPTYAQEFFRDEALRQIEKNIADLLAAVTIN